MLPADLQLHHSKYQVIDNTSLTPTLDNFSSGSEILDVAAVIFAFDLLDSSLVLFSFLTTSFGLALAKKSLRFGFSEIDVLFLVIELLSVDTDTEDFGPKIVLVVAAGGGGGICT